MTIPATTRNAERPLYVWAALAAMVSGMALGVCGAVYQILFANPLAAPDIMGVSGGATLGAAMAIVWGNTAFSAPAAFLGGMAALAG